MPYLPLATPTQREYPNRFWLSVITPACRLRRSGSRSPHAWRVAPIACDASNARTVAGQKYHYSPCCGSSRRQYQVPVKDNAYRSRLSAVLAALPLSLSHRGRRRNVFKVIRIQFSRCCKTIDFFLEVFTINYLMGSFCVGIAWEKLFLSSISNDAHAFARKLRKDPHWYSSSRKIFLAGWLFCHCLQCIMNWPCF